MTNLEQLLKDTFYCKNGAFHEDGCCGTCKNLRIKERLYPYRTIKDSVTQALEATRLELKETINMPTKFPYEYASQRIIGYNSAVADQALDDVIDFLESRDK